MPYLESNSDSLIRVEVHTQHDLDPETATLLLNQEQNQTLKTKHVTFDLKVNSEDLVDHILSDAFDPSDLEAVDKLKSQVFSIKCSFYKIPENPAGPLENHYQRLKQFQEDQARVISPEKLEETQRYGRRDEYFGQESILLQVLEEKSTDDENESDYYNFGKTCPPYCPESE